MAESLSLSNTEPVDISDTEATEANPTRRERSKIVFPYGDLEDAVEVVQATVRNGGQRATFDQLAVWMKHENVNSGTFRSFKIATARIFGLIDVVKDQVTLTELGNQIVDPVSKIPARVRAFLNVPLYQKIFEIYKSRSLPKDAALEQEMESLGVAPKQKNRARQSFQRSATQAGVLNETKDRLVLPGGVSLDSTTSNGEKSRKTEPEIVRTSETSEINPLIASLIEDLPVTGEWSRNEHDLWTRVFLRTVDKLYKVKE